MLSCTKQKRYQLCSKFGVCVSNPLKLPALAEPTGVSGDLLVFVNVDVMFLEQFIKFLPVVF